MKEATDQWQKTFHANFPLPPPETIGEGKSGWTLIIKELQDFSMAPELKSLPDTTSIALKIYVSVFNTHTGMFHGRTWTSPLITEVNANFINLATYGILCGQSSKIVIEFSLVVNFWSKEQTETSLFFCIVPQPTTNVTHLCPLFSGTPRFLLGHPTDFDQGLSTRTGQLLIELQRNDDLLKAERVMPLCTFFSKPIPGIKSLSPVVMDTFVPVIVNRISCNVEADFETKLAEEMKINFAEKYHVEPAKVNLQIVKKSLHVSGHNTHKFIGDMSKAELVGTTQWTFDGQIVIKTFMNHPEFAVAFQLVVTILVDMDFMKSVDIGAVDKPKGKKMIDVPLGFAVVVPSTNVSLGIELSKQARLSPFGIRLYNTSLKVPSILFTISYNQVVGAETESTNLPVEFKPLLDDTGGTLSALDPETTPDTPTLEAELTDEKNVTHLMFLFKYLVPKPCMAQRFPLRLFKRVFICMDIWPFGILRTENCLFAAMQEDVLCLIEDSSMASDPRGTILEADISLKAYDHVINYFMMMSTNELQAQVIDCETGIVIGSFSLPTASLLRQKRSSVQFASHANFVATDGELLGSFYFSCGCYGVTDNKIVYRDFELRNPTQGNLIISRPIYQTDKDFRDMIKTRPEPRFELAARYRDGKKKEIIMSELQKRFLRSKVITPVPGIENRFVFTSAYQPDTDTIVLVHINDERLRLIRCLPSYDGPSIEDPFKLTRNEKADFVTGQDLPIEEQMRLIRQRDDKFLAGAGSEIHLEFAFFTLHDFEATEISVTLTTASHDPIDCFTVQVKKTVPIIHENARLAIPSGGVISTSLHTINSVKMAIASSNLVTCTPTAFGIRISSKPVKSSLRCLVFFYDQNSCLVKVIRLHVDVMNDELLQVNGKLQMKINKWIGQRICCKTSDCRVAEFLTHSAPSILRDPGQVTVQALSAGVVQLTVWCLSETTLAAQMLLRVGDSKYEGDGTERRKISTSEVTLKVCESVKRIVKYRNQSTKGRTIRVTTSHPQLIAFDPTHYDVGPAETVNIRIIFMANPKAEDVTIYAYVQDTSNLAGPGEFYKFNVHYVGDDDE